MKMSLLGVMIKTYRGNNLSRTEIQKIQRRRLKQLVKYAKKHSPYFAELYSDIDNNFALENLPPTSKVEMMRNFDRWVTDREINLQKITDFMSNLDNVGRMLDGKYLVFKTSGSTGNPATILYDQRNVDVASAVAAFRTFARKADLRAFLKDGKRTAGVFANYGFYLACGMSRYLQLKMPRRQNKITIDVNAPEGEIIEALNNFQPAMLSGYPLNLALLSSFEELVIKPDVVITGGELLTDEIRQKLADKFDCYVQTHYSCTEAGEIACECSEKHLHVNEDWVIVEPVDKNNHLVGCGIRSDKVLITNLANCIQPIIRYELTDRIILHDEKCKCGKNSRWLEIEGRTDDILEFESGISIAPMSFYKILEEVVGIARFQLIQKTPRKLELRIVADKKDVAFEKAKKDLQEFLRSKDIVDVEIVLSDELPQADRVSGKYKHVYRDFGEELQA